MTNKMMHRIRCVAGGAAYLLLFLYTVINNNSTGWSLFLFFSFWFLLNGVSLLPSLKTIKIQTTEQIHGAVGQKLSLTLDFFKYRPTLLPLAKLQIFLPEWLAEEPLVYYNFTGQTSSSSHTWQPQKRGIFKQINCRYRGSDLLGLFSKSWQQKLPLQLTILPQENPLGLQLLQQLQREPALQLLGEPSFQIKNFRPYRSGDAPKQIDWKLSSKKRALIYREMESQSQPELQLLFWGCEAPEFEATLSCYYTFQKELAKSRSFQQALLGKEHSLEALTDLACFAQLQPYTDSVAAYPDYHQRSLLIFTPAMTPELLQAIEGWQKNNVIRCFTYQQILAAVTSGARGGAAHE